VIRLFAEERNASRKKNKAASTSEEPAGIKILDALAATGLRSVRYLKEIPGTTHCLHPQWLSFIFALTLSLFGVGVSEVTINDLLPEATSAAMENVMRNGVSPDR
jgi:tRNA G26 N,N-dimethylase Trm1